MPFCVFDNKFDTKFSEPEFFMDIGGSSASLQPHDETRGVWGALPLADCGD